MSSQLNRKLYILAYIYKRLWWNKLTKEETKPTEFKLNEDETYLCVSFDKDGNIAQALNISGAKDGLNMLDFLTQAQQQLISKVKDQTAMVCESIKHSEPEEDCDYDDGAMHTLRHIVDKVYFGED